MFFYNSILRGVNPFFPIYSHSFIRCRKNGDKKREQSAAARIRICDRRLGENGPIISRAHPTKSIRLFSLFYSFGQNDCRVPINGNVRAASRKATRHHNVTIGVQREAHTKLKFNQNFMLYIFSLFPLRALNHRPMPVFAFRIFCVENVQRPNCKCQTMDSFVVRKKATRRNSKQTAHRNQNKMWKNRVGRRRNAKNGARRSKDRSNAFRVLMELILLFRFLFLVVLRFRFNWDKRFRSSLMANARCEKPFLRSHSVHVLFRKSPDN